MKRSLLLALAVSLAACSPDIASSPTRPTTSWSPSSTPSTASSRFPTTSSSCDAAGNLQRTLQAPTTGGTDAQNEFNRDYLNHLDGFPLRVDGVGAVRQAHRPRLGRALQHDEPRHGDLRGLRPGQKLAPGDQPEHHRGGRAQRRPDPQLHPHRRLLGAGRPLRVMVLGRSEGDQGQDQRPDGDTARPPSRW